MVSPFWTLIVLWESRLGAHVCKISRWAVLQRGKIRFQFVHVYNFGRLFNVFCGFWKAFLMKNYNQIQLGKVWTMPSYADTKFKKSVVKCCCCGSCYGTNKWIWAIQIAFKQILFTFNHLTMTKICFSYTKNIKNSYKKVDMAQI